MDCLRCKGQIVIDPGNLRGLSSLLQKAYVLLEMAKGDYDNSETLKEIHAQILLLEGMDI